MEGIFRVIAKDNNINYEEAKYAFINYVDYKEGIKEIKEANKSKSFF